jgi:hypothetical protein
VSAGPDLDRVADVLIHVALRLAEHDEGDEEEGFGVDAGVLPSLD